MPQTVYGGMGSGDITVELFDHCSDLFTDIVVDCPDKFGGATGFGDTKGCQIGELLPQEIVEVDWTLTPRQDVKLITECDLKVAVEYDYVTNSLTTLHFIDPDEYQRLLDEGKLPSDKSFVSVGEGPIKGYLEIKDKQPIPISTTGETKVQSSLIIENTGNGFLVNPGSDFGSDDETGPYIRSVEIDPGQLTTSNCKAETEDHIKLIKGKSTTLPCELTLGSASMLGSVSKESTFQVQVTVDYRYEFRDSVTVTVEPPIDFDNTP